MKTKILHFIVNIKVISLGIILLTAGLALAGWHQAVNYESSILSIYARQQDAYVQLVLDQINLLENRSDQEIVQNILGSLDTSGRRYWTLTKGKALLFVKDVMETNRYKGLTTETFFTSKSAGKFLKSLEINRVEHATINMGEDRYVASGVIFEYNGSEYKICLLTNDTVILDDNIFLSSKIGLYVFGVIILGMLLLVTMIMANLLDMKSKELANQKKHIVNLNRLVEKQAETIREMDCYHTRWSVFHLPVMEQFVQKLEHRGVSPIVFAAVSFESGQHRKLFLERAQILLDEKVLRFDGHSERAKELILVFVQYHASEAQKALREMETEGENFNILVLKEYKDNEKTLMKEYRDFMVTLSERMEEDHGENHVS